MNTRTAGGVKNLANENVVGSTWFIAMHIRVVAKGVSREERSLVDSIARGIGSKVSGYNALLNFVGLNVESKTSSVVWYDTNVSLKIWQWVLLEGRVYGSVEALSVITLDLPCHKRWMPISQDITISISNTE
jgi:hypothetical protein